MRAADQTARRGRAARSLKRGARARRERRGVEQQRKRCRFRHRECSGECLKAPMVSAPTPLWRITLGNDRFGMARLNLHFHVESGLIPPHPEPIHLVRIVLVGLAGHQPLARNAFEHWTGGHHVDAVLARLAAVEGNRENRRKKSASRSTNE